MRRCVEYILHHAELRARFPYLHCSPLPSLRIQQYIMSTITPSDEEKHYKLQDAKDQEIDVEAVPVYDDNGPVSLRRGPYKSRGHRLQ